MKKKKRKRDDVMKLGGGLRAGRDAALCCRERAQAAGAVWQSRGLVGVIQGRLGGSHGVLGMAVGNPTGADFVGTSVEGLIHSAVRHRPPRRHDDALQAVGNPEPKGAGLCR